MRQKRRKGQKQVPLKRGSSDVAVAENIRELMRAGYSRDQAITIAMQRAERFRKMGVK